MKIMQNNWCRHLLTDYEAEIRLLMYEVINVGNVGKILKTLEYFYVIYKCLFWHSFQTLSLISRITLRKYKLTETTYYRFYNLKFLFCLFFYSSGEGRSKCPMPHDPVRVMNILLLLIEWSPLALRGCGGLKLKKWPRSCFLLRGWGGMQKH